VDKTTLENFERCAGRPPDRGDLPQPGRQRADLPSL